MSTQHELLSHDEAGLEPERQFAALFFDLPSLASGDGISCRAANLATHPFYVRLQRHWLRRKSGSADEMYIVAAQSRFFQRLVVSPMLGLKESADARQLPAFVYNHARGIANLVLRENRRLSTTAIDPVQIPAPSTALNTIEYRDLLQALRRQLRTQLHEDEELVAVFRWLMQWTLNDTASALGLSFAQVRRCQDHAQHKLAPWIELNLKGSIPMGV